MSVLQKTELSGELAVQTADITKWLAFKAGQHILTGAFTSESVETGEEKGDLNVGHHAIVTKDDVGAQGLILEHLSAGFGGAFFITEEKEHAGRFKEKLLTDERLSLFYNSLVFLVDPLDGSSQKNNELYEYSVSIGTAINGEHVNGAIYAPDVRGGLIVSGTRGGGVSVVERNLFKNTEGRVAANPIKKSVVLVGVDLFILPQFSRFLYEFSPQVRTTNSIGSCALGLALVAAGRVDAIVQPVQCPWDWSAGYPLVEEAGGKFQFYYYGDGKNQRNENSVAPLKRPDLLSYSSEKRNTAFIAGNPKTVDWLFETLQRTWQPQ